MSSDSEDNPTRNKLSTTNIDGEEQKIYYFFTRETVDKKKNQDQQELERKRKLDEERKRQDTMKMMLEQDKALRETEENRIKNEQRLQY